MKKDKIFMKRALELAEKGEFTTNPNPMVGAVLVKDGKIVGEGYHRKAGSLHAEPIAIIKAGKKAKGSTLYVNLEPCSHIGRTPPCVDTIIKSKIKKVVCAMKDPNPLNDGKGIATLKKHKIDVSVGLLEAEAKRLNRVFIKYISRKTPFVTLKLAESLDGKIATRERDSKWITSTRSREYVHKLRSENDAILVGANTIIKDNPLLTSREKRSPVKVIVDPDVKVSESSKVFSGSSPALSILVTLKKNLKNDLKRKKIRKLSKRGVLILMPEGREGKIDLKKLLYELAELEISTLLIEGGGITAAYFLEEGLVDKVMFFIAPKIIGGRDAVTSVEGKGVDKVKKALELEDIKVEMIEKDILVSGYVHRNNRRNRKD